MKTALAYAATVLALLALDAVWLGVVAQPLYTKAIGHLMAAQPNLVAALSFYPVYSVGLMIFAVVPGPSAGRSALRAAGFGFFAYSTYDLTNLATLKDWPLTISLLDVAWGCIASATSAAVGRSVLERLAARGAAAG